MLLSPCFSFFSSKSIISFLLSHESAILLFTLLFIFELLLILSAQLVLVTLKLKVVYLLQLLQFIQQHFKENFWLDLNIYLFLILEKIYYFFSFK